ncbi:LppU/SCO3897 family protein [Amycolatopsis jejuensis]|uniref:LppU/SCO3897 family protein n=1 Tax=Amycolatopsis jejuensis TaxID=330084 RepID=UPI000527B6EF|nr:hypothetical protein [Amycolatopsis jejuensis]
MTTPPFGVPPAANPFEPPRFSAGPNRPKALSDKMKALLAGLVVAGLGLGCLAAFGVAAIARQSGPPVAGGCVYLSAVGSDTQSYHSADCADQRATYRIDNVAKGRSTCRGKDYVRFELYKSTRTTGTPSQTLCLALNVKSGECLRNVSDEATVSKVACNDPAAEARAVVHDGQRSSSSCGDKDLPLVYAGPPVRTICLQPTGENI